jgi:cobalt-zinc-cadmium efflux system outer membrane protein
VSAVIIERLARTACPVRSRRCLTRSAAIAALAAFGGPRHAVAQPTAGEQLTLATAVALARANHPALPMVVGRGRAVVALARQDAAFANPVLEWRQENLGSPLQRDAFATISQPLDLTGRRMALRAAVRDFERRTVADSISVMRDVEANAARAFWRASLARALLVLAEEQRSDAERLARFETERAREGAVAEVSAMRARMEVDRARVAEASASAALAQATADLARAIGVPVSRLPSVAALAASVPMLASVPATDVAIDRALASRSELASLRAAVDASTHRYTAEQRGVLPDVVLQAGSKQTAGYSTRVIGVAVPLPLFNNNAAGRDRAAAELRFVQAELGAAEQSVRTAVAATLESYRALHTAQPGDSVVARAVDVAAIADAAYAAGGSSLLELLDARRARAETLIAVLKWVADVRVAQIDLARALGASPLDPLTLP